MATVIIERNAKFQLEISENNIIFFPSKFSDSTLRIPELRVSGLSCREGDPALSWDPGSLSGSTLWGWVTTLNPGFTPLPSFSLALSLSVCLCLSLPCTSHICFSVSITSVSFFVFLSSFEYISFFILNLLMVLLCVSISLPFLSLYLYLCLCLSLCPLNLSLREQSKFKGLL